MTDKNALAKQLLEIAATLVEPDDEPEDKTSGFLRMDQVAKELGVTTSTVRTWAKACLFDYTTTIGGHRRIDPSEVAKIKQLMSDPLTRPDNHLSTSQVAKMVGCTNSSLQRWSKAGLFEHTVTPGGRIKIHRDQLSKIKQLFAERCRVRDINKPAPDMWHYNLHLTKETQQRLEARAKAMDVSIAIIVRQLIDDYLNETVRWQSRRRGDG